MNSLLENHLINISLKRRMKASEHSCWEMLSCANVLCPAHGKHETDCWLMPRTHCSNMMMDDFFQKISSCINCSYFRARGNDQNFTSWNEFIAQQLQRYNVKALERIYQKEESFIEILNRIPDGLFTTDKDWRITYFNPAAEKITGFSAYDAVGMYCKDVFKNPICETDCALKRAVVEKQDIHNREYTITDIDGGQVPIMCSTSAFTDNAGRITGGLEIFKDISDVKRLQEQVARRERKYRRIFEGSHDSIYSTNEAGKILDMNPAGVAMLGFDSKAELLQTLSAEDLYCNPIDRHRFIAMMKKKGFVKDYEVDFKTRLGQPIHVLISSRSYENPETGDIEFEGIIKDITHRKEAEEVIRERNRELSILNSVAVALNNTMDLDHILKVTLKDLLQVLRLKRGAIFLIDRLEKNVVLQVKSGLPRTSSASGGDIIFRDRMLESYLLSEEAPLTPKPSFPSFMVRYIADRERIVPWLSCFLITFKGIGVGFFGFDIPTSRRLNEHEVHLLGSLGNFLGGSIEYAQLMRTIRQHREELRQLTEKLFQTQEEERRRIAQELHDETGQSLTAIKLGLDTLEQNHAGGDAHLKEEIDEIRSMISRTSSEIRRLSYNLHPTLLIDLGLEPALNLYFKEIENRSDVDIHFSFVGFDERLDVELETALYRFSQESLTNTLKHSGAENFRLSIIKSYPHIIFRAEDDGVGFDMQTIGKDHMSLGLIGMRERASLLGGVFHIHSSPENGTRIRIKIPFGEKSAL